MLRTITLSVMTAAFCSTAFAAAADECDPGSFLKYEDIRYSQDIATQLYFLDAFKQSSTTHDEFQGSFGWGALGINHDGVRDVASQLSKQLNINYSQRDKTWYTISKLSDTGKDAYVECLKARKQNFSVVFSSDATEKDEFFLVINSHPTWDAPNPQKIKIETIKGKVLSSEKSVRNYSKVLVRISRNLNATTEISVSVGSDIMLISLPPKPNKKLVFETRSSPNPPETREIYGGNDEIIKTMCVELLNTEQDATIVRSIPLQVITNEEIKNMGVIGEVPGTKPIIEPRRACAKVYWHLSSSDGRIKGTAQVSATVARATSN